MSKEIADKLTLKEKSQLIKSERVIGKNINGAVEAWIELERVRDLRLYREKFTSFDEYCQKRWGMQRRYADMLISSARVAKSLTLKVRTIVLKPGQLREVAKVPEARREEVIIEASKSGAVTAKSITAASKAIEKRDDTAPVLDKIGRKVPDKARPMWDRAPEVLEMMKSLSEIKCTIDKAQEAGDPLFVEIDNSLIADLNMCREYVSYALPFTVCPTCNGQRPDTCTLCRGRGVISKEMWLKVPIEQRAMVLKMVEKGAKK